MSRLKSKIIFFVGFLALFSCAVYLQSVQTSRVRGIPQWYHEWLYLPSSDYVKLTSLGYDQLVADGLWMRSIQAFGAHATGVGNLDQMSSFFDVTTDLDPQFASVYSFANLVIGEETEDKELALSFLDKGIRNIPRRYRLPYEAAFFSFWSMDDAERAKGYTRIALKAPDCPDFVRGWVGYFDLEMGRFIAGYESYFNDYCVFSNDGNHDLLGVRYRALRRVIDDWNIAEIQAKSDEYNEKHGRFPTSIQELEAEGAFLESEIPYWPALRGIIEAYEASGEPMPERQEESNALLKKTMRKGWTKFPLSPVSDNPAFPGYLFWPDQKRFKIDPETEEQTDNKYFVMSEINAMKELNDSLGAVNMFITQHKLENNGECPGDILGKKPTEYLDEFSEPWGGEWVWDRENCRLYPSTRPGAIDEYRAAPKLF